MTGGAGFIGSHLVDALLAAGRRVRVIDNLAVGRLANIEGHVQAGRVEFVQADVADQRAIAPSFDGVQRVFHLAALADIVPSINSPRDYFHANVDGTMSVLEAARAAGVQRLLYAASSSCYGLAKTFPTPEDAPIDCQYPYALTKNIGEQLVLHWSQVYRLHATALRLFNVYGPRARTSGTYGAVFGVFLAQLRAGKPLTVVGDGKQGRDFTHVRDVARAFVMAAERAPAGSVYNVGTGNPTSVNRIVELLGATKVEHIPRRPGEPDLTQADATRLRRDVAWAPQVSIEEGVAGMLETIDAWRDAPVWDSASIARATESWFKFLGNEERAS
ncbi:NAD-dependent epimerase/dehydratase family protein [Roseiterribacter gracilis]|uniref:NAD dependent epimerase/dehydratase n=1 Tax=Roseiterribacter gracilis TaxID=2812848 RepID=A0A8S8XHH6_9PROT|nr:NAD dependent epimerase/dehydratase [Rhodospirillales bacterium TMPK1]